MSRVRADEKYLNLPKHDPETTQPSKIIRSKGLNYDYTKATSLSSWLFLKYNMSYKQFRKKSKNKRNALREEFLEDTQKSVERSTLE